MLQSQTGLKAEAEFLRDVADGPYELVQTTADATRAADLVQQYSDLSLGTTDAIVIAIAERFRAVNIATQNSMCSRKTGGPQMQAALAYLSMIDAEAFEIAATPPRPRGTSPTRPPESSSRPAAAPCPR